jgi:phosphotransferase system HPr (HPr) family protein
MKKIEIDMRPLLPLDRVSAALLAQTASHFEARVTLEREGMLLNLKSMLGLLSQPSFGDGTVMLVVDGEDENEAADAILSICRK